ncbi:MAG TPA: DUF1538 domain-containing protein [Hyphomicrobiaceae bacterium]|nr:DUF1538 domain-containing protein [Hyphomicrobiaceae bacterium]
MFSLLKEKLIEAVQAVGPLIAIGSLLLVLLVDNPGLLLVQFVAGALLVVAGMMLLFAGVDMGILPMGRFIGAALPRQGSVALIVGMAFALGFATTLAEPDVLVLAQQVDAASGGVIHQHIILLVIALGLAAFVAVAMARILYGFSLPRLLAAAYVALLALALATPAGMVALAFDAGSVTTGLLTAPVVVALAIGLSSVLAGRNAISDGFGLLGFASIGPIIAMLVLAILSR